MPTCLPPICVVIYRMRRPERVVANAWSRAWGEAPGPLPTQRRPPPRRALHTAVLRLNYAIIERNNDCNAMSSPPFAQEHLCAGRSDSVRRERAAC